MKAHETKAFSWNAGVEDERAAGTVVLGPGEYVGDISVPHLVLVRCAVGVMEVDPVPGPIQLPRLVAGRLP